jgi:hypothetical protein
MDNSSSEWYNRPMKDFNDNLEIEGDLRDEYDAIQEAEKAEVDMTDIVAELIEDLDNYDPKDWA